jgi:small ligand-binding sensory domain FIST
MALEFSAVAHWDEDWDEESFAAWAHGFRSRVPTGGAVLGLVFMTAKWFDRATTILELLRVHAAIPVLIGCSGSGLIANSDEIESDAGIVVGIYVLPGATLKTVRLTQSLMESTSGPADWRRSIPMKDSDVNGWLAFTDPFSFDAERWLKAWNEAWPGAPVLGGLASGEPGGQSTRLFLNGEVFEEGAVAVAVCGDVALCSLVSQGCTPIGETWTITGAEKNLIQSIGNRPAYEILVETFQELPSSEQQSVRGNLFVGLVINEYLEEFHRGDFLVRNILGADPGSGVIAVGAFPRTGQTLQFQKRDALAATEDLSELLARTKELLGDGPIYGACLCSCFGRGTGLFAQPSHDARMVRGSFGAIGVGGFFCNGEIGPIGARNFLHGYTASLALFVPKSSLTKVVPVGSIAETD